MVPNFNREPSNHHLSIIIWIIDGWRRAASAMFFFLKIILLEKYPMSNDSKYFYRKYKWAKIIVENIDILFKHYMYISCKSRLH